MAVTTLGALATQQRDDAKAARDSALEALRTAQQESGSARQALDDATAEFAALAKQAADIRKQLAVVPTPADGDVLLAALERTIIDIRLTQTKILKAEADVAVSRAKVERAGADLAGATTRFDEAEAGLADAEQRSNQRADFKAKRAEPPLATIRTDADAALNTPPNNKPFLDAQARIEADIPQDLRERALQRRQLAVDILTAVRESVPKAQDAYLAELDKNGGLSGKAEKARVTLQRTEAKLRAFDTLAKSWFDRASSMLARVADKQNDPLTPAQAARIKDLETAGKPGTVKEKARDDAFGKVMEKEAALEATRLAALAKNVADPATDPDVINAQQALDTERTALSALETAWVEKQKDRDTARATVAAKQKALDEAVQKALANKVDPDTDADVAAARTALASAETALDTAEAAYRSSDKGALDAWEAAVPDTAWQHLFDFEEAQRLLTLVKDTDPDALEAAIDTDEAALANALSGADASASTLRRLDAERQRRAPLVEAVNAAATRLLFSALRGDR
jgi:hypothetical protein